MNFNIHYSKNLLDKFDSEEEISEVLREKMSNFWAYVIVEAENEEQAIRTLISKVGEEKFNYVLSVTPY
ncbi:hypothetical protein ACFQZE_07005 [Paenibacillus sp. GCM10027627]|uniref:hypothetical protein n=1 Tax=unclassified Paenibacillus TaxID=185978 RepID=UPI00362BC36F